MEVTHENSMKKYRRLIENPPLGPQVPFKPLRNNLFRIDGKSVVALVRANHRREGIREAFRLMGGITHLSKGVKGEIIIKPNFNTDDPFPRNTHPDTIRFISESLIESGFPPDHILVGESSGRNRGLPTRHTMENMGLNDIADVLGIRLSYFEEEEWVTVKPPKSRHWPKGIKIPRRIYEAERVILAPVMDLHRGAITFTLGLKLGVGLLDSVGREWLHNGPVYPEPDFIEKCVEINLAYSTDLVVMDGMMFRRERESKPNSIVKSGIIIVSNDRVATDAIAATIMKHYKTQNMIEKPILDYPTLKMSRTLDLGTSMMDKMILKTSNLTEHDDFEDIVQKIQTELS
jgi:uncharacterized protein (DUF362 family)